MKKGDKLPYSRWAYGAQLIEELSAGGMSLTQISRAVNGGGDRPGWADAARQHRSVMSETDLNKLIRLAKPIREPAYTGTARNSGRRLSRDQRARYIELLEWLTAEGWSYVEIGQAIGQNAGAISRTVRKRTGGNVEALSALQRVVDSVKAKMEPLFQSEPESDEGETIEADYEIVEGPAVWAGAKESEECDSFGARLLRARLAADQLVEELELLGAAAPGFARTGIESTLARAQAITQELE